MRKISSINLFGIITLVSILSFATENVLAQSTEEQPQETPVTEEQPQETLVKVRELRVPDSPALNLLGVSPNEVSEPFIPKAFGFTSSESATNSEGSFPTTFGFQVGPYWWFSHPDLTFNNYYEKTDGFGESILQSLSISVGTTQAKMMDGGEEVEVSRLGIGLRTSLLSGKKNPQFDDVRSSFFDAFKLCTRGLEGDQEKECFANARKKLAEVEKLGEDRVGFKLDIANAYAFNAVNDNFDELDLSEIGAWLTASYRGTGIDKVVEKVDPDSCKQEIQTFLKDYQGTSVGFNSIDNQTNNYQCSRVKDSSVSLDKIVFFNKDSKPAFCGDEKKKENKEDFTCVKQSGLSEIRIVDKVQSPTRNNPPQNPIEQEKQKQLQKCEISLKPNEQSFIPLIRQQEQLFLDINDWNNKTTEDIIMSPQIADLETKVNERYECRTLTNKGVNAFIVDKNSSTSVTDEVCTKVKDLFFTKNDIDLLDRDKYDCAKYSWPDLGLKFETSTLITDVDEKCETEISNFNNENSGEDANQFTHKCSMKPDNFTFLAIGRYIANQESSGKDEDNFDLGARITWNPTFDSKLQLSGEYIRRFGDESDDRFVGGVRYRITDTYEIFTSVGQAFDDGFDEGNLVTLFGLNIGLGQRKMPIGAEAQ